MSLIAATTLAEVELLRSAIQVACAQETVEAGAQEVAALFTRTFDTIALARVFMVAELSALPAPTVAVTTSSRTASS